MQQAIEASIHCLSMRLRKPQHLVRSHTSYDFASGFREELPQPFSAASCLSPRLVAGLAGVDITWPKEHNWLPARRDWRATRCRRPRKIAEDCGSRPTLLTIRVVLISEACIHSRLHWVGICRPGCISCPTSGVPTHPAGLGRQMRFVQPILLQHGGQAFRLASSQPLCRFGLLRLVASAESPRDRRVVTVTALRKVTCRSVGRAMRIKWSIIASCG